MVAQECSVDGCNNRVWGKGLCLSHIKRKPITPKRGGLISVKRDMFVQKTKIETMRNLFLEIWKERKHYSEVSGNYLGSEALSTFFHHILPKSKYPELQYDKSNIILLTLDEHTDVESCMYKFEEVNKRRIELLNKINQ
jgi:hypothetical protein